MIEKLYEEIVNKKEVRQALSHLRKEIKNEREKEALIRLCKGDYKEFLALLNHEDAKTRKNAALLLGELSYQEFLDPLFQAYCAEDQLFIRSSYLQAIKSLDYRKYMEFFKNKMTELSQIELEDGNRKHVTEEMRALSDLIVEMDGVKMHPFIGYREASDVILLTNRRHIEMTMESLKEMEQLDTSRAKMMNAGIRLSTNRLDLILPVRTYQEVLFLVPGMKTCELDPESAANCVVNSSLMKFLQSRHEGEPPFYFRVELKTKMPLDKKSAFVKKMSSLIEQLSERTLINTTSQYEFEIRLIENKEGSCNVMVKLYTIEDDRFSYRKEVIPTSIKPSNAALLVALAKKYMVEDACVLDPFCGVGTMLIERQKQIPANTSYGIDNNPAAIVGARRNMDAAGQIIHFINRDYFDFKHEYLFDEIITNMPFAIGHKSEDEIYDIYDRFFQKSAEHLKKDGLIILYSHNKEYVRKMAPKNQYKILEEIEINVREGTYLYVLRTMK